MELDPGTFWSPMTASPVGTPYHHGHLRTDLLTKARLVLDQRGADGISLREIARDLGVSSAAPRRHFRDKAALLDALALDGFDQLDAVFAGVPEVGVFRDDLQVIAQAYASFALEHSALLDLMFARKYSDPDTADALGAVMDRITGVIARAQARGEVRGGDPAEIAVASFGPVLGLVTSVRSGLVSREHVQAALHTTVAITAQGLLPPT